MSLRGNQQHSNSTKTNDFTVFLHNTDSYICTTFWHQTEQQNWYRGLEILTQLT